MKAMKPIQFCPRRSQLGAASLFVALMLLLGGTIIAFFANRGSIFEQRTSANQYRATKAFELAEAGTEWAIGKLNENLPLAAGSSCAAGGAATAATFRNRFANPQPSGGSCSAASGCLVANIVNTPGCRIDSAGTSVCECPTGTPVASSLGAPATDEQGRFAVRFATVAGDGGAVEIISRGCVNTVGNTACDPTSTTVQSDATATVRVIVQIVPSLPSGPAAALTTGSAAVTGGNLNVINTHAPSNGITIHSGTTVQTGSGAAVYTLPGTPPRASILENDPTLSNLTVASEEAFFANFFGQTLTNYRTVDPDVIRIGGCSATACGQQVMDYIYGNASASPPILPMRNPRFFVDGDITFNNGNVGANTIGWPGNEVTIVSNGTMEMRSNLTAYGVFYAATATATDNWDFAGSGTATIYGAFISRGDFIKGSGTLNLIYDPSLWSTTGSPVGRLVKVPGSWRDF
jgi:Tfp pilus assembly protein PilX